MVMNLPCAGCVDDVVNAMMFIANAASLEVSTRVVALEFIITLTETAPALARRCTTLVQGIIPVCKWPALTVCLLLLQAV